MEGGLSREEATAQFDAADVAQRYATEQDSSTLLEVSGCAAPPIIPPPPPPRPSTSSAGPSAPPPPRAPPQRPPKTPPPPPETPPPPPETPPPPPETSKSIGQYVIDLLEFFVFVLVLCVCGYIDQKTDGCFCDSIRCCLSCIAKDHG